MPRYGDLTNRLGTGLSRTSLNAVKRKSNFRSQQARVHLLAVEDARVAPYPLVVAARFDLPANGVPVGAEQVGRNLEVPSFVHLDEPVQSYPTQHFRMGMVEAAGAPFPDPLVRLAPASAHRVAKSVEHPARVAVEAPTVVQELGGGIDDLSVDVELKLALSIIAYTHRA